MSLSVSVCVIDAKTETDKDRFGGERKKKRSERCGFIQTGQASLLNINLCNRTCRCRISKALFYVSLFLVCP